MDYSIEQDDLILIGDCELDEKGLVYSQLTSANDLYDTGIPQIFSEVFELNMRLDDIRRDTEIEKNIDHLDLNISFSNINMEKPVIMNQESQDEEVAYPNMARTKKKTYKATMRLDININVDAVLNNGLKETRTATIKAYKLCMLPVVVGSRYCNTYGQTKEALIRIHEDPFDSGGYFIINGVEWSVDMVENILFNKIRIFKNEGYKKEKMHAEFISKPGDHYLNSDQFIIRWLSDGQLTIEIHSEKMKELEIPFYLIFRMIGWNNDKQIFDNILLEYDSQTSKNIKQFLNKAFSVKYDKFPNSRNIYSQEQSLRYIAEMISETKFNYLDVNNNPENYQRITNYILDRIDTHFLQHMGTNPSDRENKMRFLCLILKKVFLVSLKNMQPTDRDSYNSKRIHACGVSLAKNIKTSFNGAVIQQLRKKLIKDLKSMSFFKFDMVSIVKSGINGNDLEKAVTQSITSGSKTDPPIRQKSRPNRLTSQMLNRKNQLSALATLRQITASTSSSAKQSARSNEMRRVHPSTIGYVCVIHSPEGEKVGMNKQLAIFAFITSATSSEDIKQILLDDKEIFALNNVSYKDIADQMLCNVFVNGMWIGCCADALHICIKYRQKRRKLEIHPEVTIVWDNTQDEVYFWTDAGRIMRPLMIVYNNTRDPEKYAEISGKKKPDNKLFEQGLAVTRNHIKELYAKKLSIEDMLKAQLIEYISAEEQENMLLAPSFNVLKKNRYNRTMQYTHCDIPQAILSITALTSPFASHNQAQRIAYQTCQVKQVCGIPALNHPHRADKDTFLQYNNETPIIKTLANKYLFPNGSNCIVAMICNTGYNVEDSLIINKGAIDRGLFNGCKSHFYESKLETGEEFANPDITNTIDIKSADFSKLTNGIIKEGTVLYKNDAVIGKIVKITKNADDKYQYSDRSTIYKEEEPAVVHKVITDRNEDSEEFIKVVIKKLRPVAIGDKFSCRPTSKVFTLQGWKEIQYITKDDQVATLTKQGTLDYINPSGISKYHYNGDMYSLNDPDTGTHTFVTKNHKLYIKQDGEKTFSCKPTDTVFGKGGKFCSWVKNTCGNYMTYRIDAVKYPINDWLRFIALFIAKGHLHVENIDNKIDVELRLYGIENNNKINIDANSILRAIGLNPIKSEYSNFYVVYAPDICDRLYNTFAVNNLHLSFADYLFMLSASQSRFLLDCIFDIAGRLLDTHYILDITDIERLALLAETTLIRNNIGTRCEYTVVEKLEPIIDVSKESYVNYDGMVYCLEIPDSHQHVYYYREDNASVPMWTGNSARSGQKGTVGLILDESDMPRTADGVAPSILMNPHSIPSRMTIGQLLESLISVFCMAMGTTIDATIFKKFDIESICNLLESLGLNRHGYEKLYDGKTGEWIDTLIFVGNIYYQRLQKLVADARYTVSSGPTDALTRQLLSGKSSGGGLRIGEMERDVLCVHGAMQFMSEKYREHSDGFVNYVCRCGKMAIVNTDKGIYKCNYCKDKADIVAYDTSWTSKLYLQELESMNVGIRQKPKPFTYNTVDDMFYSRLMDHFSSTV